MRLDDNDFELFDLPRRFRQDEALIDARWRALQAQVHPDRYASQGGGAQRVALQWSVRVNEAHRRLKNPLQRALYLCELQGQGLGLETHTQMPADFLMRQVDWREALDEAQGLQDPQRLQSLQGLHHEVQAYRTEVFEGLAQQLDDAGDWHTAVGHVRSLMFVERLLRDIERQIDQA